MRVQRGSIPTCVEQHFSGSSRAAFCRLFALRTIFSMTYLGSKRRAPVPTEPKTPCDTRHTSICFQHSSLRTRTDPFFYAHNTCSIKKKKKDFFCTTLVPQLRHLYLTVHWMLPAAHPFWWIFFTNMCLAVVTSLVHLAPIHLTARIHRVLFGLLHFYFPLQSHPASWTSAPIFLSVSLPNVTRLFSSVFFFFSVEPCPLSCVTTPFHMSVRKSALDNFPLIQMLCFCGSLASICFKTAISSALLSACCAF